jgi:hypothetical protein
MDKVKSLLNAVWQFCKYVFVPQKRPKDYGQEGWLEDQLAKQADNKKS